MRISRQSTCRIVPILTLMLLVSCSVTEDPVFIQAELEWRDARDKQMQEPSSWLTIAGLFWLQEGPNTF